MSLSETVGAGSLVTIGGESLMVSPRILRHYAEIEAEIIKLRGNPFDCIRDAKQALADSPELVAVFVSKAFDEARKWKEVSLQDIGEYLSSSWRGQVFALWLAVRDNDPQKWTFDHFYKTFCDDYENKVISGGEKEAQKWMAEIEQAVNRAGGSDELGN